MSCKGRLRLTLIAGCVAILAGSCAHEAANQPVKGGADLRNSGSPDGGHEGPGGERKLVSLKGGQPW